MMFSFTLISAALLGSVTSMKVDSSLGRELLSRSRNLDEVDYSWMLDYNIKFARCHTVTQYGAVDGEDANENGGTWKETLVKYKLCPADECGYGCSGGEYLMNMKDFVDLYTENKLTADELACETTRENCVCNDDDEDACQNTCYEAAEQDYCIETDDDGEAFNVQEYLECAVLENQNGDDGNGDVYYVGPTCSENGQRVNLAVFMDEFCTELGPSAIYATYTGETLPYAEESIVAENCVSCTVSGDDDAADEVSGFCGDSYLAAAKCEANMDIYNPITAGCDYIHSIYLREDGYTPVGHTWTLIAAWVFLSTTCILAVVAGKMHQEASKKILLNPNNAGAVV